MHSVSEGGKSGGAERALTTTCVMRKSVRNMREKNSRSVLACSNDILQLSEAAVEGNKLGVVGFDLLEARTQDGDTGVKLQKSLMSLCKPLGDCGHEMGECNGVVLGSTAKVAELCNGKEVIDGVKRMLCEVKKEEWRRKGKGRNRNVNRTTRKKTKACMSKKERQGIEGGEG